MPEPIDIVIPLLQRMQSKIVEIDRKLDRVVDDTQHLKVRVTNIDDSLVGMHRRIDGFDVRLDRIERRLGSTEA
ncbi:MAG: hypothetical protein ACR2PI_10220 [Hyphomicrobiaceae bacterium]